MTDSFFNVHGPEAGTLPFPGPDKTSEEKKFYRLSRLLFCLWTYMVQQDMWEEAVDFIEDHWDAPTPFDLFPF